MIAALVFLVLAAPTTWAVRAALDFTFRVADAGESREITCDFCGYRFRDGTGQVFTLSVSAARGQVEVFFLEFGTAEASNWGPIVHPQSAVESSASVFEVGFFQKARVREGQTLKLRGKAVEFTLLDAFGPGCPRGAQCRTATQDAANTARGREMNWDAVGAVGEIVGALAVVVSLVYLACQIRIQNRESRAASAHQVIEGYRSSISALHEPEMADIWNACLAPPIGLKSTPAFGRFWELRRHPLRGEFAAYVDNLDAGNYSF